MLFLEGTRRQTAWCRELAEHGLYVFISWEGRDWRKGYRLAAAPESSLRVDQLPEPLPGWFSKLCLQRGDFDLARVQPLDLSGKSLDWVGRAEPGAAARRPRE